MKKILTIIGSTGLGKTDLAIKIAKKINGEIIGLDSRQVYKYMPIGTAQPSEAELRDVPHHLIGFRDPWQSISAGEYAKMVFERVCEIKDRNRYPIICGGAGLYYMAITKGIFLDSYSDSELRKKLEVQYEENPISLLNRLQIIDPKYGKIVHINNKKRLIRALEIFELTGYPPTEHFENQKKNENQLLDTYAVFLTLDKNLHLDRIKTRTYQMLKNGWIEEVKNLLSLEKEKQLHLPALDSIGYKQIRDYLNGDIDIDTLKELIITKTRQYARKQNKWFKKENIDLTVDLTNLNRINFDDYIYDIYKTL
tara:strand:+ start:1068 stop:1997 length:930 start_codon:yes stop_codon:yes gene_type:complete